MAKQSQREKDLWNTLDEQQGVLNCQLLPMIRLCQFASRTAAILDDVQTHALLSPSFRETLCAVTEFPNDPMGSDGPDLVADVLQCAERIAFGMNERLTAAMENCSPDSQTKKGGGAS